MNFWKDGFSIQETKFSLLMVAFAIGFIFALIMYFLHGDISHNLLNLLTTLIFAIAGVNVADKLSQFFNGKNGGI